MKSKMFNSIVAMIMVAVLAIPTMITAQDNSANTNQTAYVDGQKNATPAPSNDEGLFAGTLKPVDFLHENLVGNFSGATSSNSCIPLGNHCPSGSRCCAGFCAGRCCVFLNFACTKGADCCSGLCFKNKCV